MVTNHSLDGHPPSKSWLPTNPWKATHHQQDDHALSKGFDCTPSMGWSPTTSKLITTRLLDGTLDFEIDSIAAQLVSCVLLMSFEPLRLTS